jgi:uncharacterized protein
VRDSGHFRFDRVSSDFTAQVTVSGDYRELYDQAGLMLRLDAEHWLKAGVEYVEGRRMLSALPRAAFPTGRRCRPSRRPIPCGCS